MTRWQVFQLVADCLRPSFSPQRPRIPEQGIPWELIVEAADHHYVSPSLGWCLAGDERVPPAVRQFFETFLDLNRTRNGLILDALELALASLSAAGVTSMLLKGTAALADDLYPDPAMRILADVDLLVPRCALDEATAALHRAGFRQSSARESFERQHHHLPVFVHATLGVGIELHRTPLPTGLQPLFDVDRCFERGRPVQWRRQRVLLPDPTDRLAHNIAHSQIVDGHYSRGVPRLRPLLELALLRSRYQEDIDAGDLRSRFRLTGHGDVLADTLLWLEALLEQPDARDWSADPRPAVQRLRRAVDRPQQRRWGVYRSLLVRNGRRLIENPRFLIRTLRPRFWSAEFEGIRRRLDVTRW